MELAKQDKKSKGKVNEVYPLLMTQECWMNTYYSVVRHTGGIRINGKDNIVDLSEVWHDINIMPSDNKGIIYLTKNNKLGVLNSIKSNNWDWYVDDKYSIIKWAYIDDLLPKQFGNSEQLKGGEE